MIEAMKQAVVYFEHMVRTLKLRDESEPAQLLFKLRQAIEQAERQETNQVTLTQTNIGIGERGMEAYEAAKKRGWVGLSDERLMEMPKQEPVAKIVPCYTPSGKRVALNTEYQHLPIGTDLYTTPPRRKPLTDEEAFALVEQDYRMEEYADAAVELIRKTEAAHGIKE